MGVFIAIQNWVPSISIPSCESSKNYYIPAGAIQTIHIILGSLLATYYKALKDNVIVCGGSWRVNVSDVW